MLHRKSHGLEHILILEGPKPTSDLLPSVGEFVESISGDDVATDELHGGVAL